MSLKWGVAAAIAVYLLLASGAALTKRPWCDEACFANPAADLAAHGTMGYTEMDPMGHGVTIGWEWKGVQTHAYFIMPLDAVLQAAWFKLFGVRVFSMRSLHILLGLAAMLCWSYLVIKLTGLRSAAIMAAALMAVDRGLLNSAADGRADVVSAALGAAALAAYMRLREDRLTAAVWAANACLTACVLTHPNGAVAAFGLLYLAIRFDRERFKWKHLPAAMAPYVIGIALWGWYISLDPAGFRAQFLANYSTGARLSGLSAPLVAFRREIAVRYLERMYLPPYAAGWKQFTVLIPAIYAFAALTLTAMRSKRSSMFGHLALLYFAAFALLEGAKPDFYLVHITPLLACCAALWIYESWQAQPAGALKRSAAVIAAAVLLLLQAGWTIYGIRRNPYRSSYRSVTAFLKQHTGPESIVMGGGELGFDLGFFGPVVDDFTLGYYSGKHPDFVVVDDKCYRHALAAYERTAPDIYRHVQKVLNEECEKLFTAGTSDVYVRRGIRLTAAAP